MINFNDRWRAGVRELQAMVKNTLACLPSACLIKCNIGPDGFSISMLENSFLNILKTLPLENIFCLVCLVGVFVWLVLFCLFWVFLLVGFDAMFVWLSSVGLFWEKGTVLTQQGVLS